jgi:antitoxin ParD1/3/4
LLHKIPKLGTLAKKKIMARNTSILLGDYYEKFINEKISSGKYSSVSEVIRTALRVFEEEENKTKTLINELKIGEKSGTVKNFDRNKNLEQLKANFEK